MSTPIPEKKSCFLHGDYEEDPCPLCELNRDITAQSILSTCFVGDHPYTKAGEAIEKLAERGYSIVPTPCSHGIYHHGCPSCDRQDPEVSP